MEQTQTTRGDVVRALRRLREQVDQELGRLLASLERDSGKRGKTPDAPLPEVSP